MFVEKRVKIRFFDFFTTLNLQEPHYTTDLADFKIAKIRVNMLATTYTKSVNVLFFKLEKFCNKFGEKRVENQIFFHFTAKISTSAIKSLKLLI